MRKESREKKRNEDESRRMKRKFGMKEAPPELWRSAKGRREERRKVEMKWREK